LKEKDLLNKIQLYVTSIGSRLFRNNVALSVSGRVIAVRSRETHTLQPGDFIVRKGRLIKSGLATGSSDLIGWKTVTITPDLVGCKLAVFTAVEGKTGKLKLTPEQAAFLAAVNKAGGIAIEARSIDDVASVFEGTKSEQHRRGDKSPTD